MKKIIALLLALVMVFALVACGSKTEAEKTPEPEQAAEPAQEPAPEEPAAEPAPEEPAPEEPADNAPTKVALITDVGTIDDESFNQATWQGVEEYCEANGVEYNYYQPAEGTDDARLTSITTAVADGYNVIVLPGFLFGAILGTAQELFPEVYFIAVDVSEGDLGGATVGPNATCITFAEEQAGYLAGYAVVKDGYTKLGFLGGMAVPAVIRFGYGFVQGAEAAATELGVTVDLKYTYGGVFTPDPAITAKMEGWYADGTEIVFACGGGIYISAMEAAMQYNGMLVGVDVDQHYLGEADGFAYNPFVTSAMKGLQSTTVAMLTDLFNGNFAQHGGKVQCLSLAEGDYVGLPTAETSWGFKTFTVDEYEAVLEQIKSGAVVVSNDIETQPATSAVTVSWIE